MIVKLCWSSGSIVFEELSADCAAADKEQSSAAAVINNFSESLFIIGYSQLLHLNLFFDICCIFSPFLICLDERILYCDKLYLHSFYLVFVLFFRGNLEIFIKRIKKREYFLIVSDLSAYESNHCIIGRRS